MAKKTRPAAKGKPKKGILTITFKGGGTLTVPITGVRIQGLRLPSAAIEALKQQEREIDRQPCGPYVAPSGEIQCRGLCTEPLTCSPVLNVTEDGILTIACDCI